MSTTQSTDGESVAGGLPELDDNPDEVDAEIINLEPLNVKESWFPAIKYWRRHRKRKKYASKGYFQWYLLDGTMPEPKFVKPKHYGGGIPELKHNGTRYLFPPNAALPSEREGIRTIFHKKGEADPVNVRDPSKNAIGSDELNEFLQKRVTASAPSWFDKFDLDPEDLVKYSIGILILVVTLQGLLGGGF